MFPRIIVRSGEPKPGHQEEYYLAMERRNFWMECYNKLPWWAFNRRAAAMKQWHRAMDDFHRHGQDKKVDI